MVFPVIETIYIEGKEIATCDDIRNFIGWLESLITVKSVSFKGICLSLDVIEPSVENQALPNLIRRCFVYSVTRRK